MWHGSDRKGWNGEGEREQKGRGREMRVTSEMPACGGNPERIIGLHGGIESPKRGDGGRGKP